MNKLKVCFIVGLLELFFKMTFMNLELIGYVCIKESQDRGTLEDGKKYISFIF